MKDIIELSRFRADVQRALARRGKNLLEASNGAEQLQQLDPLQAYFVIKELGLEDATPLVRHSTEEQLQCFIDLDCWSGDAPDPIEIDAWLAPFAGAGKEALAEAFSRLESELQVLFVAASCVIYDLRNEEPPETPQSVTRWNTLDGFFTIEPIPNRDREVEPLFLMEALYRHDIEGAFRLLMAAKWEVQSVLEEQALQFRAARVQELGFPRLDEARALFSPPAATPEPPRPHSVHDALQLPAVYAGAFSSSSLLARAFGRITDAERLDALERDLIYIINSAVVAYGGSPKSLEHARAVADRVHNTLSLGLEVILSPDRPLPFPDGEDAAQKAAEVLTQIHLREVFRTGHAQLVPLARAARDLAGDPVVKSWLEQTQTEEDDYSQDRADRCFLRGLVDEPPLVCGADPLAPERCRAPSSMGEIEQISARLDALAERLV